MRSQHDTTYILSMYDCYLYLRTVPLPVTCYRGSTWCVGICLILPNTAKGHTDMQVLLTDDPVSAQLESILSK